MKKLKVDEIKELIKRGFDLELISFEFDIPMEVVKRCKQELEIINNETSTKIYSNEKSENNRKEQIYQKVEQMRERYNRLFFQTNEREKEQVKTRRDLLPEEIKLINSVMTEVEKLIDKMKEASRTEKHQAAVEILGKIKEIENLPLTIEQLEKLNSLIRSRELEKIRFNVTDKIDLYISKKKKDFAYKLAEAIDVKQSKTENLEELEILKNKITFELVKEDYINVGSLRSKIERKISEIQQKKAIDRIRNEIPLSIEQVITDLAQGTLDIEEAKNIISIEAKKKVDSKPKTRFSLTEEQEKRQILIQIETALKESVNKYHIENPELTVEQLQKLSGNLEYSINIVVTNLIAGKEFEKAKKLCKSFLSDDKESSISIFLVKLGKIIKNAEIGDIILKVINRKGSIEKDVAFFESLEKGLNSRDIKPKAVSLGKSKDGFKNINLADILSDEKIKAL